MSNTTSNGEIQISQSTQVVNFYSHTHQRLIQFIMENTASVCTLRKETNKLGSKRAPGARTATCKRWLRHIGAGIVLPPYLWDSYNEIMEQQESERAPAPQATKKSKRLLHHFFTGFALSPVWWQAYNDMCLDM
ncbi:hypothetical protein F5Y08DRAFT_339984 [Xylaria arbuscula]|nr:hypothetical protein F5Y08DRAFT_339984 [Xylaria arbuscula]